MMQQVNLYNEILKQQQQQSGIKVATMALAALVMAFIFASAYLLWDAHITETELQLSQKSLSQQQTQVNGLLSKRSPQQPNDLLLAEIKQWQNNVNEAAQTLQMLSGEEIFLLKGFSAYLRALANQSTPDVWLTAIHIDNQKKELKLEGSSFKPEQIAQALQQLQNKPALKGLTFAKLVMQQSTQNPGQIDFTLGNPEQLLNEKDHAP